MMEDKCISCGSIIPEGRMICPNCEKRGIAEVSAIPKRSYDEYIAAWHKLNLKEEKKNEKPKRH